MNKYTFLIIAVLSGITISLLRSRQRLIEEKDSYKSNTEALMSEVRRIQADSSTMALDIKTLTMSLDEYKRFRAEDEEKIKKLGIRIKDLEATAKHNVEVDAPIDAEIKDSVMIRDTVPVFLKAVRMDTPYLKINGIIENDRLTGKINLPVTLNQAFWIEYKHKFLWWRWKVKAIHQTISSDNPYVEINTMFSKLSGRTKTQEIEKPQSFASQLAEATKLFTDAVSKLKNISSGVSKKMEENDAKIKSLSVENIALQELKNKADKQAEQLNRLIQS